MTKSGGFLSVNTASQEVLLRIGILALICVLAFSTRLFAVVRFESVIHEYDPWFNYRSARLLALPPAGMSIVEGIYNFWNWFDQASWYPLGRIVGSTVYPGLMFTSAVMYWALHALNFTVQIRNICVMTAPFFASLTCMAIYLFTTEVHNSTGAGLVAAAMIAVVPGYISRSVAGSFDNEAVAIFALVFTFFLWTRSVRTGSIFWSVSCALAYFYMVTAWGGYIFIINIIPLHVLVLLGTGRFSQRVYIAYCTVYVLGTILAMQIRFVGFAAVQSSDHQLAMATFGLLQLYTFVGFVRRMLDSETFKHLFRVGLVTGAAVGLVAIVLGQISGAIAPWTGRLYSFLDPTYAKDHIPIIASVSEHQPTAWASYFFDLHLLVFLFPAGLYFCFQKLSDTNTFGILYGVTSIYFSGVMVRLMLVLAPIACVLGGIAVSETLKTYSRYMKPRPFGYKSGKGKSSSGASGNSGGASSSSSGASSSSAKDANEMQYGQTVGMIVVGATAFLLVLYTVHCTWVTSEAYSSPSIVLAAKQQDGSRLIFDDFREAYWWLRQNTPEGTRIMSWWDYGYQIAGMANRTVIVDNNTWNNSHIAEVGTAMASKEEDAIHIIRDLDVEYVLVIFGGLTGYSSDDINKFLWMVRIGGSTHPHIKEPDYYTPQGQYRVDSAGSPVLLNCLMYKLCYYRFGQVYTERGRPPGYDRVRGAEIGNKNIELQYLEEAFTSQHWLVRIYKVLPPENRV